jgi:hypothetical protein
VSSIFLQKFFIHLSGAAKINFLRQERFQDVLGLSAERIYMGLVMKVNAGNLDVNWH